MQKPFNKNCIMKKKTLFYKLLLDGYFDFCHEDCVLKEFSKMSLTDLIENSQAMGVVEISTIINKHEECLKNYWHKFVI